MSFKMYRKWCKIIFTVNMLPPCYIFYPIRSTESNASQPFIRNKYLSCLLLRISILFKSARSYPIKLCNWIPANRVCDNQTTKIWKLINGAPSFPLYDPSL